ncbi:MAG: GNVR domain-containing protein [Candidatus Eisenbacteria bacterium]|nr:GNVR domain-containing protein [Candidatus Eisenbacteria bacterium]
MNGTPQENFEKDEINPVEYFRILMKRRQLIGMIVGIAFLVSLVYSLWLVKTYDATASILPPQQEVTGAFQLPGAISSLGGSFLGIKTPADLWVGILRSQVIKDAIIDRFNLMKAFGVETKDDARGALNGMVRVTKSKEDIISITVVDTDPKRAAALANAFVEELDRINKSILTTSGRRMRVFVEARVKQASEELATAEDAVKAFQEKNRAVKLDDQSKAIIEAFANVKGQLMVREVELQTLLSYATPTNPQVELLKTQVEELKEKLRELEEGKGKILNPSSKDIFIPTSRLPDLSLQYARLLRDAKVQETVNGLLTQQYEMARIQEAKDSPTVQVLDTAQVPERKAGPNRKRIILVSTFAAGVFGVFLAFFLDYLEKVKMQQPRLQGKIA